MMGRRTQRSGPLRWSWTSAVGVLSALALAGAVPGVASAAGGTGDSGSSGETTIANNLSFPTIWSDGVQLTVPGTFGSPKLTVLDPTSNLYLQGVPDPADPTVAANIWQAENVVATAPVNVSQIDWGDSLESRSLPLNKPIRVETSLLENLSTPMLGFVMQSASGSKDTEVFGTTGATYESSQAKVYSGCARLTIQRLDISRSDPYTSKITWDAATGQWVGAGLIAPPLFNGGVWSGGEGTGYSAEINGSGSVVYGYNWTTGNASAGDYRITFSLDPNCPAGTLNTFLTSDTTVYVTPTTEGTASVSAAAAGSGSGGDTGGGAAAKIDPTDNLSYIDVELGNPSYVPYVPPAPVVTAAPSVTGLAAIGQTLSANQGTWSYWPSSFGYQWQSCDAAGSSCTPIAGATQSSYTLTAGEVGRAIRVLVSATNETGTTQVPSALTSVVAGPPANVDLPAITGSPIEGQTLSVSTGTWANGTTGFTYQWQHCLGAVCTNIVGATGQTYVLTAADVGQSIRAVVSAVNAYGTTSATSRSTGIVKAMSHAPLRTRARVTLHLRRSGDQLRFFGSVSPRHDGQRLMIQLQTRTGWKTVTSVRLQKQTRTQSQYTVTLRNPAAGHYRAYLAGDKAHVPSNSTMQTVRAKVRLTLQVRQMSLHRLLFSGSVAPRHDGQRVMIQLRTRTGWKTVGTVRLQKQSRDRSQYRITLRDRAGTYRVYMGGDSAHIPGASAPVNAR